MVRDTENLRAKYHFWGLFAALGLGAVILLPTLWYDLGGDQARYNYIAWAWLKQGIPPCKSNNDTCYMPGIIFLSMAALKMFGINVIALRIFNFGVQILNFLMIFYLAASISKMPRKHLAGIIAVGLYAVFYVGIGHWNTAQRDGFVLPLLLASACIYLNLSKVKGLSGIFLIGLMVGAAVLMKLSFAPAGLAFALLLLYRAWKLKSSPVKILTEQLVLFISALVPLMVVAIIYKITGAGLAFWKECWIYLTQVFAMKNWASAKRAHMYYWLLEILFDQAFKRDQVIWLGGFLYFTRAAMAGELRDEKLEKRTVLCLLLAVCALSYFSQGGGIPYQKIPFVGFAAIFAGEFFSASIFGMGAIPSRWRSLISCVAVIIILGLELMSLPPKDIKFITAHSFRGLQQAYLAQEPLYHRTAEYIESHTAPDQYVGSGGYVEFLFLAQRLTPTRQISVINMILKDMKGNIHPLEIKWQKELCSDLEKNPPAYFVWTEVAMPEVDCLKAFVDKNYVLETRITDLHGLFDKDETAYIYRRK